MANYKSNPKLGKPVVVIPSAVSSSVSITYDAEENKFTYTFTGNTPAFNYYTVWPVLDSNSGTDVFGGTSTMGVVALAQDTGGQLAADYRGYNAVKNATTASITDATVYNALESDTFSDTVSFGNAHIRYIAIKDSFQAISATPTSTHTFQMSAPSTPLLFVPIASNPYTMTDSTTVGGYNTAISTCCLACALNSGSGDVLRAFGSNYHQNSFHGIDGTAYTGIAAIANISNARTKLSAITGYVKDVARKYYFHDKVIQAAAMSLTRNLNIPAPVAGVKPLIMMSLNIMMSSYSFGTVLWSYSDVAGQTVVSPAERAEIGMLPSDIEYMASIMDIDTITDASIGEYNGSNTMAGIRVITVGNVDIAVVASVSYVTSELMMNEPMYFNSVADTVPVELETQFDNLKTSVATTSAQYSELQGQITSTEDELTEKQEALTTAQENLATAQANLAAVQAELTTKQSDLTDLQAELTALQETYAEAEASMGTVTTQYEYLQREVTELQTELTELTTDVTTKQSELTNITQQITLSSNTIVNLQVQLTQLQSDISSAQMSKELVQSELDAVIAVLNDLEASPEYQTYINLQQQLQSVREALTGVTEAYENVQAEYNQLVQMTYNETRVCKAKDKCPWASVNILNGFIETIDYGD